LVGSHHGQTLTDDEELAALTELLDLLPMDDHGRNQAIALFALSDWSSAPPRREPDLPRPWLKLETTHVTNLTGDPLEQPTTAPAPEQIPATLVDIDAALATGDDLTGKLAPLWNRFGPALGETATARPERWNRSLQRDPALWRLAAVRQAARELVDQAG